MAEVRTDFQTKSGETPKNEQLIKKVKCKFCEFECEGTIDELEMQLFWHNYKVHYPIFIGNELNKLGENIIVNYVRV